MASPKTRQELIARVLEVLGVAQAGQANSAEDTQLVDNQIDSVLESLAGERIVYVGDPENVDLDVFQHVAVCIADAVSADFGVGGVMRAPEPDGRSRYDKAVRSLRVIKSGQSAGGHQVTEYF